MNGRNDVGRRLRMILLIVAFFQLKIRIKLENQVDLVQKKYGTYAYIKFLLFTNGVFSCDLFHIIQINDPNVALILYSNLSRDCC